MALSLGVKDGNLPRLQKITDSFVKKNIDKIYNVDGCKSHRYRSWEYCRQAFANAREKALSDDEKNLLALNLFSYLASWGMLRNSFLLSLDYKVQESIVGILMKPCYARLFDSDGLIKDNKAAYLNLLFGGEVRCSGNSEAYNVRGVANEIAECYRKWRKAVRDNPIVDPLYDEDARSEASDTEAADGSASGKDDVSAILISKVLLGMYGCVPAYDTYVLNGLSGQNISKKFNRKGVDDLICKLVEKEDVYENIKLAQASVCEKLDEADKELYTFMKTVDILFWEIGAGALVTVERTGGKKELKDLSEEDKQKIKNTESKVLEASLEREGTHKLTVGGITFSSSDIGALIMCAYDELGVKRAELRKKSVKEHIENVLEPEWTATARFTKRS